MNDFVAFDVETANPDFASICQIGIARFADGKLCDQWEQYINPQDFFHPCYVKIHGIDESKVLLAPTFPQASVALVERLGSGVVIHHMSFDRTSIKQAFEKHRLTLPTINWLDSACVVRRTWTDLARSGYRLESVAARLGIVYQPHHAAEDARAAGEVFVQAMRQSGRSIDDWIVLVGQPITPRSRSGTASKETHLEGNPAGPLYGETAVFTGSFSVVKRDLELLAAEAGCDVRSSVTKATTLLILGDQDLRKLAGKKTSQKEVDADKLIEAGQDIRKLRETDFRAYLNDALVMR
jgi:DNA polymerase-3 subunit epsilon